MSNGDERNRVGQQSLAGARRGRINERERNMPANRRTQGQRQQQAQCVCAVARRVKRKIADDFMQQSKRHAHVFIGGGVWHWWDRRRIWLRPIQEVGVHVVARGQEQQRAVWAQHRHFGDAGQRRQREHVGPQHALHDIFGRTHSDAHTPDQFEVRHGSVDGDLQLRFAEFLDREPVMLIRTHIHQHAAAHEQLWLALCRRMCRGQSGDRLVHQFMQRQPNGQRLSGLGAVGADGQVQMLSERGDDLGVEEGFERRPTGVLLAAGRTRVGIRDAADTVRGGLSIFTCARADGTYELDGPVITHAAMAQETSERQCSLVTDAMGPVVCDEARGTNMFERPDQLGILDECGRAVTIWLPAHTL